MEYFTGYLKGIKINLYGSFYIFVHKINLKKHYSSNNLPLFFHHGLKPSTLEGKKKLPFKPVFQCTQIHLRNVIFLGLVAQN